MKRIEDDLQSMREVERARISFARLIKDIRGTDADSAQVNAILDTPDSHFRAEEADKLRRKLENRKPKQKV